MNPTTNATTALAAALGRRGIAIATIHATTPDGRTWAIEANRRGLFRLYELAPDGRREEHDAVEADAWRPRDLTEYLDGVGRPRPSQLKNNDPKPA
ncbi:MAG: hypothetical protein KF787_00445 [Phycisphaeraceae bacterium]|nr:hypothetical protein [Phycisphaerae bacterium]MBX3391091.1 hypothetical protein [Phycisphaeraceae bacterium]HRJ50708.1 hypothetical protein [Phycisphaerales bacterium]